MAQNAWHHLYKTRRWKALRAAQLRSDPLCVECYKLGRVTIATVADHIEAHKGDEHKFWCGRLQSLCAPCHNCGKQREERGFGPQKVDEQGYPIDGAW